MRYLLILVFPLLCFNSFSQVQIGGDLRKNKIIGKVYRGGEKLGVFIASFEQSSEDSTRYFICYNNVEYTTITDIKCVVFGASKKDILDIYNFLKECLNKDKNQQSSLKLGESDLIITTTKNLGIKSLIITVLTPVKGKGFFNLSSKELDKLFENAD